MAYIDGFVAPVPTAKKDEYIAHAKTMVSFMKNEGAVRFVECWGDDVPDGETTSFPMAVKAQADETVCFSWIEWPSKEVRDKAMEKMMNDEAFIEQMNPMPFDGKRMIMGGFEMVIDD